MMDVPKKNNPNHGDKNCQAEKVHIFGQGSQ